MEGEDENIDIQLKSDQSVKSTSNEPELDNTVEPEVPPNTQVSSKSLNEESCEEIIKTLVDSGSGDQNQQKQEHQQEQEKGRRKSKPEQVQEKLKQEPSKQKQSQQAQSQSKQQLKKTTSKKPSVESHDPDCPLYEDDEPRPSHIKPGARKWCTCQVCPLDMVAEGESESEAAGAGEDDDVDETEEEGDEEGGEGREEREEGVEKEADTKISDEKKDADSKKDKSQDSSDSYGSSSSTDERGMSDWDYSDMSGDWDGEEYVPHGRRRRHRKKKKHDKSKLDKKQRGYYVSPMGSERSRHEGSYVEDYMKFFVEPLEVCYKTLSSVSSSYISCEETGLQRTIVIVKPHAVQFKEVIYRVIFESGFQILGIRVIHLTPEQVSEIYAKYYGSPSFVHLVVSVSDAPILAICITAMNVIKRWLKLIGPDGCLQADWFFPFSMRKLFGLQPTHSDWLHGSENLKESNKENRYFYPNSIIEPITEELDKVTDYCQLNLNKAIVEACAEVIKKRPADPIICFADYLLQNNPFQPRLPTNIAFTPT